MQVKVRFQNKFMMIILRLFTLALSQIIISSLHTYAHLKLFAHKQSSNEGCVKNSAFALSNLARGDNSKRTQLLEAGILESLLDLLNDDSSDGVVSEVSWVLSYLSARSVTRLPPSSSLHEREDSATH